MKLDDILSSVETVGSTVGNVVGSFRPKTTTTAPAPVVGTATPALSSPANTIPKWVWWIVGGLGLLGLGLMFRPKN